MLSPSKPKRQRVDLTWAEKRKICEAHNKNPDLTHSELAQYMVGHHGFRLVSRSAVTKILEESGRWLEVLPNAETRRVRDAKWPQVDKALMLWFGQTRVQKAILNDATLVEKASEFRDAFGIARDHLKLSHGWLDKFKFRHGINLHGGSGYVDALGVGVAHAKLPPIIAAYNPEDVFNFDETGLFYRAPPSKTLNVGRPRGIDRITLGLCTNISGKERLKIIFIHKSTRPRCFPKAFDPSILVHYYLNSNAWMNGDVFTSWLTGENNRIASKGRKILILLDNAASHNVEGVPKTRIGEFDALVLSNITLLFFPANVASVVQPLDQGIVTALKLRYKRKLVAWISDPLNNALDLGAVHVDLLQCMLWVVAAWNELDSETIRNAWRVSDILPQHWNAHITGLQDRVRSRVFDEVAELGKLIAALDLGKTRGGDPVPKLAVSGYVNMVDEDNVEAELTTRQIVDLVENGRMSVDDSLTDQDGCQVEGQDGSTADRNDTERMPVELGEARVCGQKLLDFMLAQASSSFACSELLQMERICDKLSRMCVAHVTGTKQSDIKSFVLGD